MRLPHAACLSLRGMYEASWMQKLLRREMLRRYPRLQILGLPRTAGRCAGTSDLTYHHHRHGEFSKPDSQCPPAAWGARHSLPALIFFEVRNQTATCNTETGHTRCVSCDFLRSRLVRPRKGQLGPVQTAKKTDGAGPCTNKDRWVRSKLREGQMDMQENRWGQSTFTAHVKVPVKHPVRSFVAHNISLYFENKCKQLILCRARTHPATKNKRSYGGSH